MKKLVCNLKSAIEYKAMKRLMKNLQDFSKSDIEIIIAPPYPFINMVNKCFVRASQDISSRQESYAVGEVTGNILKSLDTKYVIVGHSDRQARHDEKEEDFIEKINNALKNGMKVVYCIGESREEKLAGQTLVVIEQKIARVLNNIEGDLRNIVIAYEPIWAISNAKNESDNFSLKEMAESIAFIKKIVKDYYDFDIEVLYGGSVCENNIETLREIQSDGYLVGKASLEAESIKKMANKM